LQHLTIKEYKMIRFIVGLFVVFGAVGGMDNATDGELLPLLGVALVGLALMYFGTEKMKQM
jgi:hypothetical protein